MRRSGRRARTDVRRGDANNCRVVELGHLCAGLIDKGGDVLTPPLVAAEALAAALAAATLAQPREDRIAAAHEA